MDTDGDSKLGILPGCSKPLHVQRIENATNLKFVKQIWEQNKDIETDTSEDEDDEVIVDEESVEIDQEQSDEGQNELELRDFFNFDNTDSERSWLMDVLQESEHNICQSNYVHMQQMNMERKKILLTADKISQNIYYGVGLLSTYDKYPEIKKVRGKPIKKKFVKEEVAKSPHCSIFSDMIDENTNDGCVELHMDVDNHIHDEDSSINSDVRSHIIQTVPSSIHRKKARKFKDEESKRKWEDTMTIKRKKVFTSIVKKELSKQHRAKINKHKEMLIQCKRAALQCQKVVRQKALHSARVVKEQQWRMKRLARENLAYWKRSKRVDREIRRKLEKEAEEQRKMDFEFVEAKRQQRKLNFLITQTELYAHFMSKKLGTGSPEEQLRILSQLDEEKNPRLANIDDYDPDLMKAKAKKNAEEAFQNERSRTKNFDMDANSAIDKKRLDNTEGEHPQPKEFRGNLKGYQLRGMNWLANLYDQGISGILADEMGLGKTVQSIAFLCHIAEKYSVWGPFLIISPASTLHNWQQEIAKFVPDFKVVPYWGNPNERKILRQFWDQKDMHTKDASFHIVVTSYQIVITDIKYFNRIKWQYMILDEAQAIKSTSSMRWKTLLGFSCRNRLLLSGTPIQNSMAELWALLHFIMPTLFDSHEEFNEWFSKDIESHAENKTGIDEKHLSRLHMILKPFMLRRIKKDVENELSDKIEVMVYCPLTTRQKLLYMALKQKIRIEDLLHYTVGGGDSHSVDKNFTSNLMNLVMQFRKVCNHPELFERRNAKSPLYVPPREYTIPYLIYDFNGRKATFERVHKYFYFTTDYINDTLKNNNGLFHFMRALKLTSEDMYKILYGDVLHRWRTHYDIEKDESIQYHRVTTSNNLEPNLLRLRSLMRMSAPAINSSTILKNLVFTTKNCGQHFIYTHTTHVYHSMSETVEHRNIRFKSSNPDDAESVIDIVNDDSKLAIKEFPYEERPPQVFQCEATTLPGFLFCGLPKIQTNFPILYCYSRRAMWDWSRFIDDYSLNSCNYHWSSATGNNLDKSVNYITYVPPTPFDIVRPRHGWSPILIPDKETLVTDSGKLSVLDGLLKRLKEEGHRVLIYSQMTRMIDLLEEYMWHRHHKFMRLDGSSKISERRDMVADFQARADIFVFLLSTRAGGLGINLTAADTVIFYDSDWNPTVDQQAMDRAHRLGQTKQVTVYRLICKGSIEERILQRAREKSEIQKLVISGGNFKPDTLKPKEVVSLLLDDEEIEQKYRQRTEERKLLEDMREMERKRKHMASYKSHEKIEENGESRNHSTVLMAAPETKKIKQEGSESGFDDNWPGADSGPSSPHSDNSPLFTASDEVNDINFLDVDGDSSLNNKYTVYNIYGTTVKPRISGRGSSKRGRPRGSRRTSALGRFNSNSSNNPTGNTVPDTGADAVASTSTLNYDSLCNSPSNVTFGSQGSASSGYSSGGGTIRRGPGRPRLKPSGPGHSGTRGPYRPRRPARPLPVPLPSDTGGSSAISSSTGYSTYLYDYSEQPSDS
ncbi:hypothetical protein RN001_016112 [Aquatica leii]|uniref:Chromatin-remodeling ATPase INO80 n=1 Tax=Aquatica leii TaxID=1421715 RepID=A0AAN7NZX5_9COLE|nr:hypothetical protein RN001_016112 [Aquatica leii]